ncbi:enoyl-CoA hydratase/isomerase family protein [Smaragdicoccus niigatensis]|uniref:enoyl-CoA hydratase/isomerase family protein n=1 Tax=Smaragdicoccus niigatensis TaxID=359359 RepID=UPI0003729785|nr:enoyl-CoA hydratase/isomerase family protein [Smaragdicoccus niigatensis]
MVQQVKTEQVGRVLIARLDNPPYALMTTQMVAELDAIVDRADSDDGIGVVVITGARPDRFLAHFDVRELLQAAQGAPALSESQAHAALRVASRASSLPGARVLLAHSPARGVLDLQLMHKVLLKIGRSGAIFIAAINGETAGGGLELSLACDLRYLTEGGELAQPEVLLGFPPGGGGTQRLTRLIGRAAALEIMLTARVVPADEALRIGLVTGLFPADRFLDEVLKVANSLATRFKPAVGVIKRAALEGASQPLEAGLLLEQAGLLAMLGEKGAQQSMKTYVDYIDEHGAMPSDDPEVRKQLLGGTFAPFYPH